MQEQAVKCREPPWSRCKGLDQPSCGQGNLAGEHCPSLLDHVMVTTVTTLEIYSTRAALHCIISTGKAAELVPEVHQIRSTDLHTGRCASYNIISFKNAHLDTHDSIRHCKLHFEHARKLNIKR